MDLSELSPLDELKDAVNKLNDELQNKLVELDN